MLFSIILPNYNSSRWINKCIDSILSQVYNDFELIIVDDMSTDDSVQKIKPYNDPRIKLIELDHKAYNGGTRNIGVANAKGEYILFIDCDDWVNSNMCLFNIMQEINKTHADLIRLPYIAYRDGRKGRVRLHENSLKDLVNSIFCAPWTKCVKREKFVPFPENTLLEDVVQHIAQVDNIESIGYCDTPFIVWNRSNPNAISSDTIKYDKNSKRYSSVYRNLADLLDLRCKHDYCEEHRLWRIKNYEDIIQRGDILGLINGVDSK